MATLASGLAFGAALTTAGVYQPSVIISQLRFENWHMIQTFLTATASSAVIVAALRRLGYIQPSPRTFSPIGVFAPYDGNVIGGALLGVGMALSGACPGTVFAQVALGVPAGFYALQGAILGGIAWTGFVQPRLARRAKAGKGQGATGTGVVTIQDGLGVGRGTALVGFELVCAAVIVATSLLTPRGPEAKIHPVLGGLIVASAQLLSVVLRKTLVGTSSSFEEVGNWFWGLLKGSVSQKATNIIFCLGVTAGSYLIATLFPRLAQTTPMAVPPLLAGIGGFLMIVGSRMAGGCTSGHGISGMSLLSLSSCITIGTAFGVGGIVATLLY